MTDREFMNMMSGLFNTMNNIYTAFCDSNNVTNRDIELNLWYNDSDNTPQRLDYQCDGQMIPTEPWWDKEEK